MRIAVAIPHTGTLKAKTAVCLGNLLMHTTATLLGEGLSEIRLLESDAGPLEWKRDNLARLALERGTDYLLWIDSDQTFEPDALVRLMAHDKPIIAGIYRSRHDGRVNAFGFDNQPIKRRSGIEQVAAVGFGFVLMKTQILKRIGHPWFATTIAPDGRLQRSEDIHFCNQARQAGFSIWVDHDLDIGHRSEVTLAVERQSENVDPVLSPAGNLS